MGAADAPRFVDHSDPLWRLRRRQSRYVSTKQLSKSPDCNFTAGRAEINGDALINNRFRVRPAPWIAALGTLGLRQQVIDPVDEIRLPGREVSVCSGERNTRNQGKQTNRDDCRQHSRTRRSRTGHAGKAHERERHDAGRHQGNGWSAEWQRHVGSLESFPYRCKQNEHQT